jgi:HD-like signal output (HDOD) protein
MRFESRDFEALFSLTTLPPVPAALPRLWSAHADGREETLVQAVEADGRLALEFVRLVNALEGRRVASTRNAVRLLGGSTTLTLALTILVRRELLSWARRDSPFDRVTFWRHSVGTAAAAYGLAEAVHGISAVHAYAGGLLHDVGLLAIDLVAPRFLSWNETKALGASPADADFERVHSRLGRAVADRWNLPTLVTESIAHHHAPHAAPEIAALLAAAVCVADSMAASTDPYLSGASEANVKRSLERLGLTADRAGKLCRSAAAGIDQAEGVVRFARPD